MAPAEAVPELVQGKLTAAFAPGRADRGQVGAHRLQRERCAVGCTPWRIRSVCRQKTSSFGYATLIRAERKKGTKDSRNVALEYRFFVGSIASSYQGSAARPKKFS
jgi:hypothetical protein